MAGTRAKCPKCKATNLVPSSSPPHAQTMNSPIPTNALSQPIGKANAQFIVTTGDLRQDYEIVGPVYFQVSNKGVFSSELKNLMKKHTALIAGLRQQKQIDQPRADWGFLIGEWSIGQTEFDQAFFVAVQELKARAAMLGADAIIGMRQDIDLDSSGWQFFYLQMYGTAVKLL